MVSIKPLARRLVPVLLQSIFLLYFFGGLRCFTGVFVTHFSFSATHPSQKVSSSTTLRVTFVFSVAGPLSDSAFYRNVPRTPSSLQITREAQLVEQEKIHINALLAEGKTRQEIAQMGLYSALDPNVMGPEAS
ncbi:unnamed protein product [Ectocarpus sp. 12 AP-2014]